MILLAATGCDPDVWALVHSEDGTTPLDAGTPTDASAEDAASTEDAALDAAPDAGTWAGQVYGTGFDEHAGLVVYGRVGSTGSEVASATIQPDGSFVLQFTQVTAYVDASILYVYIDVTESGGCDDLGDYVAETIASFPDGFELHITPADLTASIWGCFRFS
jgi:hypothetical protein